MREKRSKELAATIVVKPTDLLILGLSLFASVLFYSFNKTKSNDSLAVLPSVFGFGYFLILLPARQMLKSKTITMFTVCEFLRLVVLPLTTAITNRYGFNAYRTEDASLLLTSTLLIAYEFIAASFVILLYCSLHRNESLSTHGKELKANAGESMGLIILIILAGLICMALPEVRRQINFLVLDANSDKVRSVYAGANTSITVLALYYVHYAFLCFFILIIGWMQRQTESGKQRRNYTISLIIGLFTIATIFGESRSSIVYTAYAVYVTLTVCYPQYKRRTIRWILLCTLAVFIGMTLYRLFTVYRYTSYVDALSAGSHVDDEYYTRFLESYLLGPQSVAAGIELGRTQSAKFTIPALVYDIFRPCVGFNVLLKNLNMTTSITLYNSMLYGQFGKSNGFFLQITAQGYCYLGFLLAPMLLIGMILCGLRIERRIESSGSLFAFFFLNLMLIRVSTCVLGGTLSGVITSVSMLVAILVVFVIIRRITHDLAIVRL